MQTTFMNFDYTFFSTRKIEMNENLTCFEQSPKLKPPETLKKWFSLFFTFLKNTGTGKQAFCIAKAIHATSK